MTTLLNVEKLTKHFPLTASPNIFKRLTGSKQKPSYLHAVDNISFTLNKGESLGLVGESGCGKSTLVRLLTRLLDPTSGHILFNDRHIGDVPAKEFAIHPERAKIQQVFQDPTDSLNPRFTAFDCIADPLKRLQKLSGEALQKRVEAIAAQVSLPLTLLSRYPHQLSGGQKLRVGIARGIALQPDLLILDEPTSALDVSVQAVILKLLDKLRRELGLSYLFVSHDLNVVRLLCDRVMAMYLGKVVETGPVEEVFQRPRHPYTKALIAAISHFDAGGQVQRVRLQGELPSPIDPDPHACRFYGRCPAREDRCLREMPELEKYGEHKSACLLAQQPITQTEAIAQIPAVSL
ncbi:ABC transporter ATP-binding protein [Saccharophagus sp. K07]|uniref:oligopeptide/dipeptide ABC transporter ATP-binding protein n=1 Tax=Saccharophagus sp. K07 TaxID=2283636 RepID=UPI001652B30E|nr:ABC transporter ATP-binding protein [Saccharophagus sp. K07]MBC6907376.1 ABC transporter ATP-binding protein [Saccharophagus sp. K07]